MNILLNYKLQGMPSKWNTAYDGEDISELKTKMSEFKSLWVANEKKQALSNQASQVQLDEHEQMMAATAEESAALALIESDLNSETRKAEKTKINKNKICKLWESKEQNSTDMWEVEKVRLLLCLNSAAKNLEKSNQ